MKLPANYIYVKMPLDERDELYREWCSQAKLDPAVEYSVEEFFTAIDGISEEADECE